ncbi:LysM peptidoglycan-binding domain-containing protein [Mesorhizobium sp.]|uniref:LysM peptidoglycan-binding domain-containing protein n=1 Tax=Mesorhizobium sp. TaxID=1871066 RepID=UPI000FE6FC40|nr:LysM peptidoglycan-binding domain-containing protein [Mesorhizobium sp.]RWE87941.1 MAG: LysM peptidoglycan-binding domain-containing protein [Mesorhizobium sp.]TIS67779.1 MAG: LysM peptidoglycan-binding domain-containing protein [Mesorhizobium sp.]
MIRPINTLKPPPPPRVDPKANAEQITRLQAEATKLHNEIRLANKMGEADAAASARQRLTQVNAELTTAQPTPPAAQPGPELPAAVTAANGNGGTAAPALFTTQNFGGTPNLLLTSGEPDAGGVSPDVATANDILNAIEGGKSIDNIAHERNMSPEQVVAALNVDKMTATATEHVNGDTRTVVIKDGNGRTITENQDYHHGGYYTEVTGRDGQTTSSPIRDDLGRKETTSIDAATGAITTKLVDDLGDGSVTERTTNPQTRITTTIETNGDGAVTVTNNLPNGSTVETVTPAGGPALPVTTVTGPGGEETILAHSQAADGSGAPSIQEQLAEGKSFEEIAEASNLTPEQVIAELNAAGLEVTQGGDPGETLQIVVTDPETGDTVTYNNDYQHGSTSVTTVEGNTETTDTVDGNGRTSHTERNTETGEQTTTIVDPKNNTETTIVFDKDGRRTETIVEKLGDGEPIDYEVQPGDNLSDIAEAHGVTLEDLAESNPELFTSPRDPDLIHPGETVVIEDATKTTVNVTFNGYTLTTSPDGKITLTNDTTGAVTDIAAGTAQQALAELLLSINPNGSDPEQAKEDLVVKTTLDGIFGGATPELTTEALEKQQAVVAAMEQYGPGQDATGATLDGGPTSVGPYGDPPSPTAPSGGKWVPLLVDGSWKWFDPEVAKAIAAENVAIANFGEAQAKSQQIAAQLDIYALDPEFKNAMEGAESTLDEALAPYGLDWRPPEPKGTLADAQDRLTLANNALEGASTARAEYEQGQTSLLEAIDKQADLPTLSDPNQTAVRSPDGPSAEETNQQGKAAHAEVAELFTNLSLHTANGNKATIDLMISSTELELKLTDAKPGSPEYTAIEERLEGLQTLQGAAANQVTLAEAYQEYGVAQAEAADLAVTMEPLKQQLLAQAQERNPHHFDWEGYTNGRGEFTGKIKSQDIIEDNGQLYVVTVYENDTFTDENGDDTNVHKSALTYDLNDEGIREDFRNDPLNKQWQEMLASTQDISSAPVCTANGTGSQSALDAAKSKIVGVQVDQLDAGLRDAKTALVDATTARDQAITDYGPGTVEAPAGTLKPGETAVKITVNGRDLWVAPEVAAAYEEQGPGAIGDSGKWVQIEMDGQKLWVHPEVAAAEIDRGQAETEKNQLEDWEENVRPAMVAGRDWYAFSASHPKLLEYGSAEHEAKLKYEYFEEHKDQALAGYQVQFENLYEAGYTGEYETYTPDQLSTAVGQTLGLDAPSEDVRKVTEEITDRAGSDAEVKIVPVFSLDGGKESTTALFAIKSGGDEIGYVDSSGKYYSTFDEFQHENRIFSEKGNLVMAKGGDMSLGEDGFSLDELEVADARKVDFWDKATDIGLGIVAGVSTIVSFVPGGQWAIPIAIGSGSILGGKALIKEGDHLLQGGDFDSQSAWNVATGVTAFLPVGAGALRTFGLAKTSLSGSQAFAGGFGMTRMKDASWGIGRFQVNVKEASYAGKVSEFMQGGNRLTTAAWRLDAGAVVTGVPLLGKSVEDLAAHGGEMSLLELANAVVGIGVGTVGTGLGGRSLLYNMPGTGGTRSGTHASASFPGGPDSGPQPRAVYEMGPDGVYRPTGEQVVPDPDEIIIDGDVVGETSGQQEPGFGAPEGSRNGAEAGNPGQRALPAGESDGPNPPPPTGGKDDPSGDVQPSRPMVVHEQGPDGVYRPTDKLVFHDPSHPVVEGTVVNVHDEGPSAPGERGDSENASDRDAQGAREQNVRVPADGDPIVVPPVRGDGTTRPAESGFRLVWDPATKTFTGMPRPNPAEYVYTSGKDPQQTGYLDGARPSDPAVLATPDELLLQSETETRGAEGTRPLMRYTLGNRHTGEMLVDFNLPEAQRVVAIPEPKAITAAPEPVPAPVELDPSLPVRYLGADGRWTADPNVRTQPPPVTDTGHPSPVRHDGTPVINNFSSNPYSFGQTFNAVKAGLRRIGTRYLNTEPRYDYPKLGELVDSIYHRPVPQDGVTAGQDIYVEAGGEYLPAKVIVAGPQASMTRDTVLPGEHATDAGYLSSGPTVERAKRGSITTPNGQLRVNTPAREVHTFDPADNPEVSHRSALGETLAATLPALPDHAATPAPTWMPEQVELVGDYLHSLEGSSDPVVRDAVTMTRVQLGGRGLPQSGTAMTQAQHHALGEMLNADRNSPFTGSKPVGQLSMNGLTTLQVFSAQGKLPHLSPGEVIDQLGLSSDGRLPRGEQFLTAGALPGEAGWTDAGRGIVGDYLKAASGSTDPNLAAAANAASPFFKGRATKPGKAVTAAQQDALMQVLEADSGSTWVYGPKLQPESSFKPAGKLSPEGRYNAKALSGHETWTPYLWREMRGYAANQQKSADPAVQSLARALENALPPSKPKAGTEINSEVAVLLERLLDVDKASSWRVPTFFTDAQGVWRSDRATVSWFLQEHEANVLGGPVLNDMATNTVGLGGSMLGIKVPLPSRQVYGELSLKNNGPDGTGFLLPVHPNDAKGHKLFANGFRPNFAYDDAAAPSAQWVASAPMLSKNTFQKENAAGVSISIFGFSVSGAYVKRTLLYLGGEGGRLGYTHREPGPLSQRAASFWEEAARGGASHYSSEGKVPGFEDRLLYRNYNVIPPFGGGKEPWRGSPAFEGVPRETGAGPLNRLDRTDHGAGLAVNFGQWPVTTVELGTVRKDLVPHTRTARAHPGSSEGAQKVFSALEISDGRLTPDVLQHLHAYLAEVAASPHGDLKFAGQRVLDVFPELGVAPYPDQLATTGGRPDWMGKPAWKALRQQLDQQARGELTPTQAHYLNRLLELHSSPPANGLPPAGEGPIAPRSPAPRPVRNGQDFAADGSLGRSFAKALTQAEIAANRQEAASLLDDMLHQNLGMPEVTKANLTDQLSRSPTLMELLRGAHAKGVRIVNPARHDLRIFDANSGDDLTATGSQYVRDVGVVFVDAETFRAADADSDIVLAEFVDMLGHELSHVADAKIELHPDNFPDRQAYKDAVVSAYLNVEGEATFVQYAAADELAVNSGKPAAILGAEWNSAQADIFARFKAGEIGRSQAVEEMATLFTNKQPSAADGTYGEFYGRYADERYDHYASTGSHSPAETRQPAPANKGQSAPNNGPLTRDGVRATPLDHVPDLVMGDFQPTQIPWLKREQVAELTEQQFRDMDQAGLLPYLTKSQLRGIPKAKIGQVNIAGLDGKQIPWLTEGHFRNVTDQQFRDLGKAGLTPHLTKPQLRVIKGDMVELVDVSKLEARQVPWFKPGQVAKFTSQQFKDLGEAGLLKNLTEPQVPAIPETMIDSVDVAKLDPKQVPWLSEKQIPVLNRDQWGAFTIHHTEALTQPQIEAVTPKQFGEMSPGQFRKFTLEQFEWMSGDQTNALSVLQLTTYRATHKKAMTPDQATSVDLALSHARTRENTQALATFGGMSTTSVMLWSSLPPTWTATAGAVAFGVRGVVFGAQALFPNATASHKPFGRFLNALGGATFIAAAPGAATGMIQGKDLVVNSTFTLGNIVYGTKSMLQSFTGRPVIRNLAEYLAGPGYVLGCAFYTVHSWPAPIATVAGTMFTFGCAEFWASAIRTDRMNRRSVPRTDADIAAAEKSDKRWAAWDRWTLGITFGVGMLLFSLDALLAEPWEGAKTTPPPDPKKPDGDASSQQPDDPSDVPDEPQTPPEDFPQLVVVADDGLNLRAQPDEVSTVVTVLQPGTFVEQTAKPSTDQSGESWIPVEGFGPDGDIHSGWVSGDHVEAHPEGSSNPEGRTNPTLEKDGYQWVEVQNGDSIRLIAKTHSADVAETVVLNMDHILSPDVIFSGDRIYLPATLVG